jgi:hypothetical protein
MNATSPDGIIWTKHGESFKGIPGSLEVRVTSGSVIISSNSVVNLWYGGSDGSNTRIFLATLTRSGHIVSEEIGPFQNCDWGTFFANKTEPSADVFIYFSILDGVDWTTVPGYGNLSSTTLDLSSVNSTIHPTIGQISGIW